MKLPEKNKKTIYFSNETYFGSGNYTEPYALRGLVFYRSNSVLAGGGVIIQQNTVELQFESNLEGIESITQKSLVWINKVPNFVKEKADFTHIITSRSASPDSWYVIINCKSAKENTPIL